MHDLLARTALVLTTLGLGGFGASAFAAVCCPPDAPAGSSRCIQVLAGPSQTADAACAAVFAGSSGFAVLSGAGRAHCDANPGRGLIEIRTDEYASHGWVHREVPAMGGWIGYRSSRLAVQSPACEARGSNPAELARWRAARERCWRQGYEAVHVYVSMIPPEPLIGSIRREGLSSGWNTWGSSVAGRIMSGNLAAIDPWSRDPVTAGNVRAMNVRSADELRQRLDSLVEECKVISFGLFDSHGSPSTLYIGNSGYSGGAILQNLISPCALAPRASLQFNGCDVGCRETAGNLRDELQTELASTGYATPAGTSPFEGVRMLFNTSTGISFPGLHVGTHDIISPYSVSHNDVALVYTMGPDGRMTTDIPLDRVPACHN